MTRKDISVIFICLYMISVNLICWYLFGREIGLTIGNIFGIGTVALFVFWVKSNKKVDKWLEAKI